MKSIVIKSLLMHCNGVGHSPISIVAFSRIMVVLLLCNHVKGQLVNIEQTQPWNITKPTNESVCNHD